MGITILVSTANHHSGLAAEAIAAGLFEVAQDEMEKVAEAYQKYCAESTDAAANEQQDDEDKEAVNEPKPDVTNVPSGSHCVQS